ncbi:MAG: hypothetical protein OQK98_02120 [Gammaproteobacteria bacterium]|nr:hypothetical protein [Gammaproteobacteria bacterium]
MKFIKSIIKTIFLLLMLTTLFGCGDEESESNTVSIEFVSAVPSSITLQGTGGSGLSETSNIQFRVKDPLGNVLTEQTVNFSLSTSVGGITLNPATAISDENGFVNTIVQSGAIPTAVRVIANIPGTDITSLSGQLAITAGIPDQDSMTVAATVLNPEGLNFTGEESTIVVHLGDIFNNFVPEGTTVSFKTEGGSIEGSCISSVLSDCNVIWRSQDPTPVDGRVTIVATALGQESFVDENGNGIFDQGDTFTDMPEAFRDDNENGIRDVGEEFLDLNNNGIYSAADGLYNGSSCLPGYALCSAQKNIHVRDSIIIVMSGSSAVITGLPATITLGANPLAFSIVLADINNNSLPGGTSITIETTNGTIDSLSSFTVPNRLTPITIPITITGDDTPDSGVLEVVITTPNNQVTSFTSVVYD